MTHAIGPRDLLEAKSDVMHPYSGVRLEKSRIYVCTVVGAVGECVFCGGGCENVGIMVREAPLPMTWAWCSTHFKPIGRGDTSMLWDKLMAAPLAEDERDMLRPPPEPTPADIYRGEVAA